MSRFLQQLLDADEPLFTTGLSSLERATGMTGIDVQLIGDVIKRGHWVMRELGLDPADTTAREIYLALQAYVRRDDNYELLLETDYVILPIDGEVISFNLIDAIENSHYDLSLDQRCLTHGRRALRGELVERYLAHNQAHPEVVEQIAWNNRLLTAEAEWYNKFRLNRQDAESTQEEDDMKAKLSQLLEAEEPLFSTAVDQLAEISGDASLTDKLAQELDDETDRVARELGLDPETVTGEELHQALINRVADDNERITKLLGGTDSTDVKNLVPLMIDAANKVEFDRKVFVLKHETAKKFMRQMPPKQLMARLGYDDVDAMFENEDFDEIYTALRFSEGDEWLNQYNELFKTVTADDYEERDIRILAMDHSKYVDLAEKFTQKKLHNVTHTKELGVIVVVPLRESHSKGLALKTLPLLLHYLNEIKLYSDFFRHKVDQPNFGEVVVDTLIADPGSGNQIIDGRVHWRVIQRYFGKLKAESPVEAYEPHVHPEDLHWRRAEDLLYKIDPEMGFWRNLDWIGRTYGEDSRPVVLNFIDVAFGYANEISYDERYVYHMRESLWNELFSRHLGEKYLNSQILEQLDNDMIDPAGAR